MKILYFFPYDGTFMTEWQRVHIFNELSHYGIEFEIFNPLDYESKERCNENLVSKLKYDKSIDFFLNCLGTEYIFVETMKELKKLPIPKVLICFDNLQIPYVHKNIAPFFDLVWLTSWETQVLFDKWGCNTIFMPYAANPFWFKDCYDNPVNKVSFIGTPYGTRSIQLNQLVRNEIELDVFCKNNYLTTGNDSNSISLLFNSFNNIVNSITFPEGRKLLYGRFKRIITPKDRLLPDEKIHHLPQVNFDEMNKVYSNYSLSLNITELRNTALLKSPIYKLHLRTFEIPMAYGLELTHDNSELRNYFQDDEMIFYSDLDDLVSKAKFYTSSKNDSIVRRFKLNARKKAENEHTWMCRFEKLFDKLGISKCD